MVYTPPGLREEPGPAVYYIHGGAFQLGSVAQEDGAAAGLALTSGCIVVSVDYRLAPETPHPGPVEDCYAGLAWLGAHTAELNVDPGRIAVYGHSAGGGLAALVAQIALDRGGPPIRYQMLCYPMLDDRADSRSMAELNGLGMFDRDAVVLGWSSLLGDDRAAPAPYGAAARRRDHAGLPPAYLDVGALDVLSDEVIDYARRLMGAGVRTELHVYPAAYHGFDMFSPEASVSQRAVAVRHAALRQALGL